MSISNKHYNTLMSLSNEDKTSISYMSKLLIMTNLPYRDTSLLNWTRTNGLIRININSNDSGIPYGTYPRIILSYIITSAIKNKSPIIYLGKSFNDFLKKINLNSDGGKQNKIIQNQLERMLSSSFSWSKISEDNINKSNFYISDSYKLWWPPKNIKGKIIFEQNIELNREFYEEITKKYIPIDLKIINSFKSSPMFLDLYMFFKWRTYKLKKMIYLSWNNLFNQLGNQYSCIKDFKKQCKKYINMIIFLFPEISIEIIKGKIILKPSF